MGYLQAAEDERVRVMRAAIEAGTTTIDTAPLYEYGDVETAVGKAIASIRADVEILSKVGLRWDAEYGDILFEFTDRAGQRRAVRRDSRPESIRRDVEGSLQRLGTDRIDLCQIHQPDRTVPIAESIGALERLVEEGKILHIGVSNFMPRELDAALEALHDSASNIPLASNQLYYNLIERAPEKQLFPLLRRHGVGVLAYSPLEAGALTGKLRDRSPDRTDGRNQRATFRTKNARAINNALESAVAPIAERHDASLAQICLAWLLQQRDVSAVIAGASGPEQAVANARACDIQLSPKEEDKIASDFARVRIDPDEGLDWRTRGIDLARRVRRKLGGVLRGD
jgi:aryl-alcohol dehydrogenase-like predicted oxidoreductase